MKFILIGASGQLGGYLKKDLLTLGEVLTPSHQELDITQKESIAHYLDKFNDATHIINTAAFNDVNKAHSEWQKSFNLNCMAVNYLASLTANKGMCFVTFSTDYVFNGQKKSPYLENDMVAPLQVYGASKAAGESLALAVNSSSMIVRTAGLYGGHGSSVKGNFVLNRINDSKTMSKISIASNQFTSTTYAGDLSKAVVDLLSKKATGGIYHLTNSGSVSWAMFATQIFKNIKSDTTVLSVNRDFTSKLVIRPAYSVLGNSNAKSHGVVLPHWRQGLLKYLNELSLWNNL